SLFTLSLHDALPIFLSCRLYTTSSPSSIIRWRRPAREKLVDGVVAGREGNTCRGSAGGEQRFDGARRAAIHPVRIDARRAPSKRSEEHTSELQSRGQ